MALSQRAMALRQGENVPGNVTTVAQEKRVDDTNLVAATGMRTITENAVGREIVIVRGIGTVTGKERGRGNTGTVSRKRAYEDQGWMEGKGGTLSLPSVHDRTGTQLPSLPPPPPFLLSYPSPPILLSICCLPGLRAADGRP